MAASDQRTKSAKMAADLVKRGIWHGRRMTTPRHNNYPVDEAGSAAYRRLMRKQTGKR
jgi:hypothetical protein